MGREYRRLRAGDVPAPRDLNWAYDELRRWRRFRGAGGLAVSNGAGPAPPVIDHDRGEHVLIRLTGPYASGYPWAEVVVDAAGVVTTTGRTGGPADGDPAFERRTGDTGLTAGATVFLAVRSRASNQLVFPHRGSSGGGGGHLLAGCSCVVPDTVTLHCGPPPTGTQSVLVDGATFTWGAKPADLAAYPIDDPGYYSAKYTTPDGLSTYRLWFTCSGGRYVIASRTTPDTLGPYPSGGTATDWLPGLPGNTCSPFSLTNWDTSGSAIVNAQHPAVSG